VKKIFILLILLIVSCSPIDYDRSVITAISESSKKTETKKAGSATHTLFPTKRPINTKTPIITPKQIPIKTIIQKDYLYGPMSGSIIHEPNDNWVKLFRADGDYSLENFIVEATFIDPYSNTIESWDYGIVMKNSDSVYRSDYSVIVSSNNYWSYDFYSNNLAEKQLFSDKIYSINLNSEKNRMKILVFDNIGLFFLNDKFEKSLDFSKIKPYDSISLGTGFFSGNEIDGKETKYQDFFIYDINQNKFRTTSGILNINKEEGITFNSRQISVKNFIAKTTFINPDSIDDIPWSYGFQFRYIDANNRYLLAIDSLKNWKLYLSSGGVSNNLVDYGVIKDLNTSILERNSILLFAIDDVGILFVNGTFIAEFDLSNAEEPGEVAVAGGIYSKDKRTNLPYYDFIVFRLP